MKISKFLCAIYTLVILLVTPSMQAQDTTKKVVMIVTSYGQQQGVEKPGYEFDEFAKAYAVFNANGIVVDVASPIGGPVEADKYDKNKPYNAKVLATPDIMAKLANTMATKTLKAADYDGIFIVGGKGAMFDLPKDKALQTLIANIYQQKGSVAAVCHGPAALVDVKLADGSYLVANKAVNGFTNQEETLFGKKWLKSFDFLLEDKLIERGGKFQSSAIMLSHVAVDGRLITGQNPASTTDVANALVKNIGLTPIQTAYSMDDQTMALIAGVLAGEQHAVNELSSNRAQYHIPLVGMYGFYYLKVAEKDKDFENALTLMLIAKDAINNPMLDMKIAKTQQKLGKLAAAKATAEQVLKTKPDFKPAQEFLKALAL